MTKINTFSAPLNYEDAIRAGWPYFIKEISSDLYLQYHFVHHMRIFDEALQDVAIINREIIDTYLNNLLRPFTEEQRPAIEKEFNTLLNLYGAKIKSESNEHRQKKSPPKTLFDISVDDIAFDLAIKFLQKGCPGIDPVLTSEGLYIGGEKGKLVIAALVNYLRSNGTLDRYPKEKTHPLVCKEFPGLSISYKWLFQSEDNPKFNEYFRKISGKI